MLLLYLIAIIMPLNVCDYYFQGILEETYDPKLKPI